MGGKKSEDGMGQTEFRSEKVVDDVESADVQKRVRALRFTRSLFFRCTYDMLCCGICHRVWLCPDYLFFIHIQLCVINVL